ncbi:MAG: SDR family oxidoreductase [Cyanobacteria bacterium SBLK]|nr:SDR family oxidoreductase [Cyanobacteria bacterium SBLK]
MKRVLILGAKSDIAKAIAHRFAKTGCNIDLAARNSTLLEPLVKDLSIRYNCQAKTLEFDALDFKSHGAFYESLTEKPDIVICVFGYLGNQDNAQKDFQEAEKIINTNYTGAVSILNIIANDFEQRQQGTIAGISSVAGDRGRQSNYFYGSAKAAFTAYLSGLRNRLTKAGVHVITVKPGYVATKMTEGMELPQPLTASPEQVSEAIFQAIEKQKNAIYTLWMWQYIMLIIRSVPEFIFKKLNL